MKRKSDPSLELGGPPAKRSKKPQWTRIKNEKLEREMTVQVDRKNPGEIKFAGDPQALDIGHIKLRDRPAVQDAKLSVYVVKRCGCRIGKECGGCSTRNSHCVVEDCTQDAKHHYRSPFFQDAHNGYRVCNVHKHQFVHDVCKRLMFINPVDKKLYCVACKQAPVGLIGQYDASKDQCDVCETKRAVERWNAEPLGVCIDCFVQLLKLHMVDHPTCDECAEEARYALPKYGNIAFMLCAKHCTDTTAATLLSGQFGELLKQAA